MTLGHRAEAMVLVSVLALVAAGCGTAAGTPQVIYVTPAPTPSPIIVYVTPPPATPTPAPTPTPSPTSPAAACSGSATTHAFLAQAAATVGFDLYCGVMPQGWSVSVAGYSVNGMSVRLRYRTAAGGRIDVQEGPGCVGSAAQCSQHLATIGTSSFGGLSGEFDLLDATPSYILYVNPGTDHAYEMYGEGLSKDEFVAAAAAMTKVARVTVGSYVRATDCTGSATIQAFFAQAAFREPFDVYCGAMPKEWSVSAVQYDDDGALLDLVYENGTGGWLEIGEGALCDKSAADCSPRVTSLGKASVGDLPGEAVVLDSTPTYAVYVAPGTTHAYEIDGKGVTQAQFVALAAALIKVARPGPETP